MTAVRPDRIAPPAQAGIAVVGEINGVSGFAGSACAMIAALRAAGVTVFPVNTDLSPTEAEPPPVPPPGAPLIIHANPNRLGTSMLAMPRGTVRGRRVIGYWAWELPVVPPDWRKGVRMVHEVWVPSRFVADAIAAILPCDGSIPLRVIPHALAATPPRPSSRSRVFFGIPRDAVVVLTSFNFESSFARKNPLGAIAAFRRAFGDRRDRVLVLKILYKSADPAALAQLHEAMGGVSNIMIEDRKLSREDNLALIAAADIVLSLHRSEGFGLVMAEAMLSRRPVVATAWSGNMDFMDDRSAALVTAKLVAPDDPTGVFALPGAVWADPDLDEAAMHLRRLADDPAARMALGAAGFDMVSRKLTGSSLVQAVRDLGLPVASDGKGTG
jgi:glycosyltransferase involved in cell wall biosynthesis